MYKIWDEGNDGSGSGLDADLLDGKHISEISKYIFTNGTAYALAADSDLDTVGCGYYTSKDNIVYPHAPITNFGLLTVNLNGAYKGQIVFPYGSNYQHIRFRSQVYENGIIWNGWRTLAYIDDNVASATYATSAGNADTLDGFHAKGNGLSNLLKWGASAGGNLGGVWCKLASWSSTTTDTNTDVGFLLHSSFSNVYAHIICRVRKGEYAYLYAAWAYGIDASNIKLCYDDSISNFELWYYGGKAYSVVTAELLYESNRNGFKVDAVTMYSNNQGTPSLPN
jgi:hypothetical protein